MPYVPKWMPSADAVAHICRVEKCHKLVAMRQLALAVRDGAIRWYRSGYTGNHYDFDALVYRDDVLRLWLATPEHSPDAETAAATEARLDYAKRVAEFRARGEEPPLETTKSGVLGDLQWAPQHGVSRPDVKRWREEEGVKAERGRPSKNRQRKSAEK